MLRTRPEEPQGRTCSCSHRALGRRQHRASQCPELSSRADYRAPSLRPLTTRSGARGDLPAVAWTLPRKTLQAAALTAPRPLPGSAWKPARGHRAPMSRVVPAHGGHPSRQGPAPDRGQRGTLCRPSVSTGEQEGRTSAGSALGVPPGKGRLTRHRTGRHQVPRARYDLVKPSKMEKDAKELQLKNKTKRLREH